MPKQRLRAPYLVLLLTLALAGGATYYAYAVAHQQGAMRLERQAADIRDVISARMQTYINTLTQTKGFLVAAAPVTRAKFSTYVDGIDLLQFYPGIQGLGYAMRLRPGELAAHIAAVRREGFPGYEVWPQSSREDYFPIVFLEPFEWRNQRAFGYDMFSEPARRAAMMAARDTGLPAMTHKVTLVQETETDKQAGFLIYVPVYRSDRPVDSIVDRRRALAGFVYSPFRAGDLFDEAFKYTDEANRYVAFEVYDGDTTAADALLYAYGDAGAASNITPQISLLTIAGRTWTLRVLAVRGFQPTAAYLPALLILAFGVVLSTLLFGLMRGEEERRRAAEEAQEKTTGILESITDAFCSIDRQWRFTYVNREAARVLGYTPAQLLGRDMREVFPQIMGSVFHHEYLQAIEQQAKRQFEAYYPPLDTWFEVRAYPSRESLSIYFRNISEQRRVREAIHAAQERFRAAFAHASIGMVLATPEGRFLEVNPAYSAITGYTREELAATDFFSLAHPSDQEHQRALVQRMLAGEIPNFDMEKRYQHKDGAIVWVHSTLSLIRDQAGRPLNLVAISQDITERKQAEALLAAEKERLTVTLYSIGDGVITTDTRGRVALLNKAAEQLTGWSQAQAEGEPVERVFTIVDHKTGARIDSPVARVLRTGEIVALDEDAALIAKDGSRRLIADSGAPIRGKAQEILGVVLVFRDITERKKMEEEVAKARNLEAIGVLAGGIAHDFNNILTAILGNISLAKLYSEAQSEVFTILSEAEKAFWRARDLTQQLLTFAKGGMPVKTTASVAELVRDTATFALRGSNVRLECDIAPELWTAEIDVGQISQVINNLVINAKQAMPEGGVVSIRVRNAALREGEVVNLPAGSYLKLAVSDTGVGILPEHVHKIFDPYFTTKQQGSGLGLATTYSIIARHQGHIEVESRVGEGTTFTLYLPVTTTGLAQNPRPPAQTATGQGHVLLMDDELPVRKVAHQLLTRLGYDVSLAQDGGEALTLYRHALDEGRPFDAVVLDLTVPGRMGGKECLAHLRELDPHVKAIVSSGYSTDPVMAEHRAYGFRGVVAKPYQLHELSETLRRVIAS
jgi:PAS domain S-box-containing protein